jgi:putative membrane protein
MEKANDKKVVSLIVALSIIIPIAVFVLMILPEEYRLSGLDVSSLPLFHAILNGSTAVFLLMGLYFVKNKNLKLHKTSMLSAFALSCIFLVSYVIYHYSKESSTYGGEGVIRSVYFFILISHILLAVSVVPLALFAIFRGLTNNIEKHKRIVRFTFPIWLYVSITGVLVYLFMMPYYG